MTGQEIGVLVSLGSVFISGGTLVLSIVALVICVRLRRQARHERELAQNAFRVIEDSFAKRLRDEP